MEKESRDMVYIKKQKINGALVNSDGLYISHHQLINNLMRINTSKISYDFHKLIRIEND